MAPRIVSWSDNEICITPVLSSAASIVSFDSTFSDTYPSHWQMSPTASEASELPSADFGAKHTGLPRFSEGKATKGAHATSDNSFMRHDAYFFKDGNVTFLIDGTLYCVHRYFFSRDSVYFSTRFAQLVIRDYEALPTIISIGDIERNDFEALLSILYPANFGAHELTYEQWRSVLHLSTRWGFASLRKLALKSITPPTAHDQFVLARTYSVDHWVLPALTALCERTLPLSLDEARQMSMEDVILVATVREEVRGSALRVDAADIRRHVEVAQAGKLDHPAGKDVFRDRPKSGSTGQESDSTVASGVGPNVEVMIAKTMRVGSPSGPQQGAAKEGDTHESDVGHSPKEIATESPGEDTRQGLEQPHVVGGIPQDFLEVLEKCAATCVAQTRGTQKVEEESREGAAWPRAEAKAFLTGNRAVGAMAWPEVETKVKLEAEAKVRAEEEAKAKASAEVIEEIARARAEARTKREAEAKAKAEAEAREKHEADAKANAGAEAWERAEAGASEKREAEAEAKAEDNAKAAEEAKVKAAEEAKQKAEKERLEVEAKTKAEAAKAKVEEQIARLRTADKAARAIRASAPIPMHPARGSGGSSWFSKIAALGIIPTEEPTPPPKPTSPWGSDPWSKGHGKNVSSPDTKFGSLWSPGGPGAPVQHSPTASSNPRPRGAASTHPVTSIKATQSSASVVSSSPTLVSQERKLINDKQDGKAGNCKGNQTRPAQPTATDVPDKSKGKTAVATADKTVPSKTTDAGKTSDVAGGATAPDAPGDKSAGSSPSSTKAGSAQAQKTTPQEVVGDSETNEDPAPASAATTAPRDAQTAPPVPEKNFAPEKDATVTKPHTPTSEPAALGSLKPSDEPEALNAPDADAKKASETPAQTEAPLTTQGNGMKPDGTATEHALQPNQNDKTGDEKPTTPKGDDTKSGGPGRPALRLDHIREVSTASTMFASSPGTPDDAPSSSLEREENGDASGAKLTKNQKKRLALKERAMKRAQRGEKNGPRPPSRETSNSVDNLVVQEPKPVAAPVDTYSYRGGRRCPCGCEGESGEGDVPVVVEKPDTAATTATTGCDDDVWTW